MSCSRKTNRWPMSLFYGMINNACINVYIIYSHNVSCKGDEALSHKNFMKNLSRGLSSSFMSKRLETPTLKRYLRNSISNMLPKDVLNASEDNTGEPVPKKRTYCIAPKIRRKASASCNKCIKVICREHNINMCQSCT